MISPTNSEARALLERVRARYVLDAPAADADFEEQKEGAPPRLVQQALLAPVTGAPPRRDGAVYRAQSPTAKTDMATTGGKLRIADPALPGVWADVALEGAPSSSGQMVDGYVVYLGARDAGMDLLHRPLPDGVDQFVSFERAPAASSVGYDVTLGEKVAGVRLVANTFELVDAAGIPRLRMAPPTLIDSKHAVQAAVVSVKGCTVDTNPAAPWDHPVTLPNSRRCRVEVAWDAAAVAWPALLDPAWTTTGSMATPRSAHTATSLGSDTILVAGGRNGVSAGLTSAELYHFLGSSGAFAATSSMAGARYAHAAANIGAGSALVSGGMLRTARLPFGVTILPTAEIYDRGAGTWLPAAHMAQPRAFHTATTLHDGSVLVVGGMGGSSRLPGGPPGVVALAEAFVVGPPLPLKLGPIGHWLPRANLASPRYGHTATLLPSGLVVVVGGPGAIIAELYHPTVPASFSNAGMPGVPRIWHAAALLPSGDVVVAGGSGALTSATSSETWKTGAGFSAAGNLASAHSACHAVTVPLSKKVLLTGGGVAPGNSAGELYDPALRTWSSGGTLVTARDGSHSETLLSDGRVLVAGGDVPAIGSAELFDPCTGSSCDDGNACTTDTCSSLTGCKHVSADACGTPSCSLPTGGCSFLDTDGDGLSDAWETNGYVDVNCNGVNDGAPTDLQLPGADKTKPDVYVLYDWQDLADSGAACTCTATGVCSNSACVPAAATFSDLQCVPTAPGATTGVCRGHSHDPEALAPGALARVVAQFASHGINLHLIRGHARPHSRVTAFEKPKLLCEGADVLPGTLGDYAVNLYDLKGAPPYPLDANSRLILHYAMFAHYSSCDSDTHCAACSFTNPDGTVKAVPYAFGETGISELPGNDFIVSLGNLINDVGTPPDQYNVGGTFMHELGHNLGLRHGGGSENTPNFKPNYLSVMNYTYQTSGIRAASVVGGATANPSLTRLDYSTSVLPVAGNTPDRLDETKLNEPAGIGSGTADLFSFNDGLCSFQEVASTGPVDWNGDGSATDSNATADLNPIDHPTSPCGTITNQVLRGHADWGPGASAFGYNFQCTSGYGDGATTADLIARGELTPRLAMGAHTLYAPLRAASEVRPGCPTHWIAKSPTGKVKVALYGSRTLDVSQVDIKSLRFAGVQAESAELAQLNQDKIPDLLIIFPMANERLSPRATTGTLGGYLKNSQAIIGTTQVTVVPSPGPMVQVRADKSGYSANLGAANDQFVQFPLARCVQSVVDRCGVLVKPTPTNLTAVKVTWSEPSANADAQRDAQVTPRDPSVVSLRRTTTSDGRLYRLYFQAADAEGNVTESACNVGVPGKSGALPSVDAPARSCSGDCAGLKL